MSLYWEKAGSWRTGPKQDRELKKSNLGDSLETTGWDSERDTSRESGEGRVLAVRGRGEELGGD